MGGQNHQPCNRKITAASAWLSQKVGEGFISVLAANNHLENAIIIGMDKLHIEDVAINIVGLPEDHIDLSITSLREAMATLEEIPEGFSRLQQVAETIGYIGNPNIASLNELNLKEAFAGSLIQPTVNEAVWNELHERIRSENILRTLAWESKQFSLLAEPTRNLIQVMQECRSIASVSGSEAFVDAIENNEVPLRQYYAQVFSQWNNLHAMFLYSALIMTELYYQLHGHPSLTDFTPVAIARSAAA